LREKSIVGDLINFRGLVYAPVNENGVIFLFGKVAEDFNMYIEEIKPGFPDCIARRFIGKGWERVAIEFEYQSYNFKTHGHDPEHCDLIVCWEHNWKDCPIEVLELKTEIQSLENNPVKRPDGTKNNSTTFESIEEFYRLLDCNKNVQKWFNNIYKNLTEHDDNIWAKVSTKFIGLYSPEKSFASVRLYKNSISIESFSRGAEIEGISQTNKNSPRWIKFSIKKDDDAKKAINILLESQKRLKEAIEDGEPTSYFSGGELGAKIENDEEEEN